MKYKKINLWLCLYAKTKEGLTRKQIVGYEIIGLQFSNRRLAVHKQPDHPDHWSITDIETGSTLPTWRCLSREETVKELQERISKLSRPFDETMQEAIKSVESHYGFKKFNLMDLPIKKE